MIDGLKFLTEGSIALGLLLVAVVQACVYWSQRRLMAAQWNAMERSLKRTDRMIDKMQEQLVVMQDSVTETRNIIEQNERSLVAYFGIKHMEMDLIGVGAKPRISITFVNGGKTPAWHFDAWVVGLDLAFQPTDDPWSAEVVVSDIGNRFFPAEAEKTFVYIKTDFVFTQESLAAMNKPNTGPHFFVHGTVRFTNIARKQDVFKFCGVYNPGTGKFSDYYTAH